MIRVIKENDNIENTPDNLNFYLIYNLLTLVGNSEQHLNELISRLLSDHDMSNLMYELIDYEVKPIYQRKMSWWQLSEFDLDPEKVYHAIYEFKTQSGKLTIAYNEAQNALSFAKSDGPIKFYNIKNKPGHTEFFSELKIIFMKLLK
jgi:hypothetical protein